MRVLLLHPEDTLPAGRGTWDLIVDLARAPQSTYERWQSETGCRVTSVFDYAADVEDLHRLRELITPGMGLLTDDYGVDWWDVLSVMIVPDLHMMMLARRLFADLGEQPVVATSRPHAVSRALSALVEGGVKNQQKPSATLAHKAGHYAGVLSRLRFSQMVQVAADKFDRTHSFRRRWSALPKLGKGPAVLLPTAYSNTSKTAVAYARMLPDQRFLLVYARRQGKLQSLPANVSGISLDPYFAPEDQSKRTRQEMPQLLAGWRVLKARLMDSAAEFRAADAAGILDRMPGLLGWGTAVRDAWMQLMNHANITACLSADDGNPYS